MSNVINILVVEDESIVSKDIQNSLKKIGYNVIGACNNAQEAIDIATELHPDVVLMDIMLKGNLTGIAAAEQIKLLNIPVIFLTAYADEATLAKAKITEPYGYILKPFKEKDLNISIEMAIHRHKKLTELRKERDFLYSLVENKEAAKDVLFVKSNSRLVKINTKDIFFIEALKDYVVINTELTRYTIHSTMKDIEKKGFSITIKLVFEKILTIPKKVHWKILLDLADFAKRESKFDEAKILFKLITHI